MTLRTRGSSPAEGRTEGISGAAIVFGFVVTAVLTLVAATVTSLLVHFTAVSEMSAASAIYYAAMLCAAAGGAAAARRAGRMGWLHGGAVGFLYALGSVSAAYAMIPGPFGLLDAAVRFLAACAVGVLGGIIGMNL